MQAPVHGARFHSADRLLDRLEDPQREVVFVVGSALTMSAGGVPGVPGVAGVVKIVRDHVGRRRNGAVKRAELDALLAGAEGRAYQVAFDYLNGIGGAEACNAVIRDAVLQAHAAPPADRSPKALRALELDPSGWHLPPAVKALGQIVARAGDRFAGPVLTTNFDPLIEVAIRAAGGQAEGFSQLDDRALPETWGAARHVIHINGHWLDDTWHTPRALTLDRARLRASLKRLFDGRIVVALAYGGWEDALMASLAELVHDIEAKPDVLWGFYAADPGESSITTTLSRLGPRAVFYAGVDAHRDLPALRARLDGEAEQIGRSALCTALIGALDARHAVELIGEPNMKRSRLLLWLEAKARALRRRVVRLNAGELARKTPEALLRAIAERDGRYDRMHAALTRNSAMPDDGDAAACLSLLDDMLILVDNADALAGPGNGFTARFFDAFRARMQDPKSGLQWVSVSRGPLEGLFAQHGWASRFLNDSVKHRAGALDRDEVVVALRARLGDEAARRGLAAAGTVPRLVYRLCEAEFGDVEAAIGGLGQWGHAMFGLWWQRPADEQAVLKAAVDGIDEDGMSDAERALAVELCHRGLMVETADGFALNGSAWGDYVRGAV